MELRIAACGVLCSDCAAYRATSPGERQQVAAAWRELYGREVTPETVTCTGCLGPTETAFPLCADCPVRRCVLSRGLAHCGLCDDYPCATVEAILARYDELDSLAQTLPPERFATYVLPYCHARERLDVMRAEWDWS